MAVGFPSREDSPQDELTLGSLLYADGFTARVSEQDWVTLIRSIATKDQRALQALYAQSHRIVFTLCMRITGSREMAEEVTLDVFHGVWQRAATYDPAGGPVLGWIMNQARSRAIDRLRFEQRKKRVAPEADAPPLPEAPGGPHETLESSEQGRLLREALHCLTPEERQTIETAFFSELTYREAAERLNHPLGTVKTRVRSALGKLRDALTGSLGAA